MVITVTVITLVVHLVGKVITLKSSSKDIKTKNAMLRALSIIVKIIKLPIMISYVAYVNLCAYTVAVPIVVVENFK